MTPQELKNSILQMAIQGKLVEQRPEEGTAEELYQQIRDRRSKGKENKLSVETVRSEEMAFDIPSSWKWVRFGHIMINRDAERIPLSVSERSTKQKIYDYYGASGIIDKVDDYLFDKPLLLIGEDGANLLSRSTPIAFIAEGKYWVNNHAHVIDCYDDMLYMKYIMYFINAVSLAPYVTGTAQPKMNQEKMNAIPIALPPLAEQKRIVNKIEELLPLIDRYEKAWARLEEFNKSFPGDMQKSLLQMAIQGKLVEQRPEEGTAEELYQQIQAEKQKLIKEGKIKKEKPLPEITEEEKPFDIPDSWKWCRFGTIVSMQPGFAFKSDDFKGEGSYKLLRGINLGVDCVRWDDTVYLDHASEQHKEYLIHNGDVLLGLDRPWISDGIRVAIFCEQDQALLVQRVLRIRETSAITNKYATLMLRSVWFKNSIESQTTGISVPHISPGQVANFLIPLPPLAEQKRIVARLEELLPLCDKLK